MEAKFRSKESMLHPQPDGVLLGEACVLDLSKEQFLIFCGI